jgi:hypothetical protein
MLIVLAGLSEPEVDVEVSDVDGRVLCRFDLSCPDLKIVVERGGAEVLSDPRHERTQMFLRRVLGAG